MVIIILVTNKYIYVIVTYFQEDSKSLIGDTLSITRIVLKFQILPI